MDVSSYARNFELAAKDLYTKSLLFPESFTAKVPGPLPISSATAALRDNFSITPNTSGKFLLYIFYYYYFLPNLKLKNYFHHYLFDREVVYLSFYAVAYDF